MNIFTPCILQTLIIAVSIVLIILFLLIFRNKWQKPDDCSHCKKDRNYHTIYISGYFIMLLILFFTYDIVKEDKDKTIFEYFSFASVIVSIILAVLTIVYSYYSNSRSMSNVERLDETSRNLNNTSRNLNEVTDELAKDNKELSKNIKQIIEKLDEVNNKVIQANENIKSINNDTYRNTETDTAKKVTITDESIKNFIDNCGFYPLYFLLACKYSHQKDKTFKISNIIKDDSDDTNINILLGFAYSLIYMNFITNKNEEDLEFNISSINNTIEEYIEDSINESVKNRSEERRVGKECRL